MSEENTFNVDPNPSQPESSQTPMAANPLNTGNGTPSEDPTSAIAPVQNLEAAAPTEPQEITVEASAETPAATPAELPTTPPPAAPAETAEESPATSPVETPTEAPAETPQEPMPTTPLPGEKESKTKMYLIAAGAVIGLIAVGFLVWKFFLSSPEPVPTDEAIIELTNSLSNAETTPVETTSTETEAANENEKLEELEDIVTELEAIYSDDEEVFDEAVIEEMATPPTEENSAETEAEVETTTDEGVTR